MSFFFSSTIHGSTRTKRSFARSRLRACFRALFDQLEKLSLEPSRPSANFLLRRGLASRDSFSGSQFRSWCPRRDRACVMSECTKHRGSGLRKMRWNVPSENWPFRKLQATSGPTRVYFVPVMRILVQPASSTCLFPSCCFVQDWRVYEIESATVPRGEFRREQRGFLILVDRI